MRIPAFAVLSASILGLSTGCADKLTIKEVYTRDSRPGAALAPAPELNQVPQWAKARLSAHKAFAVDGDVDAQKGFNLGIAVRQQTERSLAEGKVRRSLGIYLGVKPATTRSKRRALSTEVLVAGEVVAGSSWQSLWDQGLDKGLGRLHEVITLSKAPLKEVLTQLKPDAKDHLRKYAIDEVAHRKLQEAVPALAKLLESDQTHEKEALLIVGTLLQLKAQSISESLISSAKARSPQYLVQMIFALGQLGGRGAEAYLFTVQSGHASPEVREAAKSALAELEARAGRQ